MTDPGAQRSPPADSAGVALLRLLTIAAIAWLIASALALWQLVDAAGDGLGLVGAPFLSAGAGWLPGGLVLLLVGAVQAVRGRMPWRTVALASAVYALPPLGTQLATWAVLARMPHTAAEADLGGLIAGLGGPLAFFLFLAGLVLGWAGRRRPLRAVAWRTVGPPVAGGALGMAWLLSLAVSSPEFRHGDAFALSAERTLLSADGLIIEAVLEVGATGPFRYEAIYLEDSSGTSGGRMTQSDWPDVNGPPQQPGRYRWRLTFAGVEPDQRAHRRRLLVTVRGPEDRTGYAPPVAQIEAAVAPPLGSGNR